MCEIEETVSSLVLDTFDSLPAKSKPRVHPNGMREWVPLSGIVLSRGHDEYQCVSLATGMKCLPSTKLPLAKGNVLHDWHAEILAIRCFNRFLMDECYSLATVAEASDFVRWRRKEEISETSPQPFMIKEGTEVHMYCTEAPCGDASMELTMAAQDDPTPWTSPLPFDSSAVASTLTGRSHFSELGIVRRKPSRPDAPPTLSKSCSDKLSLAQCASLLKTPATLLLHPSTAYLQSLIVPHAQLSPIGFKRAFSAEGRMSPLTDVSWNGGYRFQPFVFRSTSQGQREFAYSRHHGSTAGKAVSSNLSAAWTRRKSETLVNGVLQGRKLGDPRGACMASKRKLFAAAVAVLDVLGQKGVGNGVYAALKTDSVVAKVREHVKEETRAVLGPWPRCGGDDFPLIEAIAPVPNQP